MQCSGGALLHCWGRRCAGGAGTFGGPQRCSGPIIGAPLGIKQWARSLQGAQPGVGGGGRCFPKAGCDSLVAWG